MTGGTGDKGNATEETLRHYFLEAGYFVARGVPLTHDGHEVTDVDLWLYSRTSVLHRSRTNVDVKSRQRSKAFERVLWAKGLQAILGLDGTVVATTDRRPSVKAFAIRHGVKVLDGDFLHRLDSKYGKGRLTDEELFELVDEAGLDRMRGQWRERLRVSKGRLLSTLDFSGCNHWMSEVQHFLGAFASRERESSALRASYLNLAYFHIGLDFRYQTIALEPEDVRQEALLHGFRYGEQDMHALRQILRDVSPGLAREMTNVTTGGRELMLAKFYSETKLVARLFDIARKFEVAAYAPAPPWPDALDIELKSILGLAADYCSIDRRQVLRNEPSSLP